MQFRLVNKISKLLCLILISQWYISCSGDIPFFVPSKTTPYLIQLPWGFPQMDIPSDNPMTIEGVELGKELFFDPILSIDSTMSCASCHFENRAFTDGKALSSGVHGIKGKRSAMSLINTGFYDTGLFWDGRSSSLEVQALLPVADSSELANQWQKVEWDLRKDVKYLHLFQKAFSIQDSSQLTRTLITKAIAQYERSLVSNNNSKYDRFRRGVDTLSSIEMMGYDLFFDISVGVKDAECGNCHNAPLFTTNGYANNGIQTAKTLTDFKDLGQGKITNNKYDNGKFRIPSLRNISLTAPYMHDGRFKTLEEVLDHYNQGGHPSPNIHSLVRPLGLTAQEKASIIAFLHTLTDEPLLQQNK